MIMRSFYRWHSSRTIVDGLKLQTGPFAVVTGLGVCLAIFWQSLPFCKYDGDMPAGIFTGFTVPFDRFVCFANIGHVKSK